MQSYGNHNEEDVFDVIDLNHGTSYQFNDVILPPQKKKIIYHQVKSGLVIIFKGFLRFLIFQTIE